MQVHSPVRITLECNEKIRPTRRGGKVSSIAGGEAIGTAGEPSQKKYDAFLDFEFFIIGKALLREIEAVNMRPIRA